MYRGVVVLLCMLLVTMACSLGGSDSGDHQKSTPLATASPVIVTVTPYAANTPTVTASAQESQSSENNPVVQCTPRTDWPVYVVVGGDTLASIASSTGSTTAQLTSANCLSNANLIAVGQQLRVPTLPSSSPQKTTSSQQIGQVQLSPNLGFNNNIYALQVGVTVTLNWPEITSYGRGQVDFIYYPVDSGIGVLLGMDTNLADGATLLWQVPRGTEGRLGASARLTGQDSTLLHANLVGIFSADAHAIDGIADNPFSSPLGSITFTSDYVSFEGNTYTLKAGERVFAEWTGPYGWTYEHVKFLYYPDTGAAEPEVMGYAYPQGSASVSISWSSPSPSSGKVIAVVRVPGYGDIESLPVSIRIIE